jgi:hypothetical protein
MLRATMNTDLTAPGRLPFRFPRWGVVLLLVALGGQVPDPASAQEGDYAKLTSQRVDKALAPGGRKEITTAEASLTALGWFVLYGNDSASYARARKLNTIVGNAYTGTDKMKTVYADHTAEAYAEMLNLRRFQRLTPAFASAEYTTLVRQRVEKAFLEGAGPSDFRLAEGSLCALGWLTLFGNDAGSLARAKTLMQLAAKAWPGANDVYKLQTSEAYAEMINLGRFTLDR